MNDEGVDSYDKEDDEDMVEVDKHDLDNVPQAQTFEVSVAKRLRSNKGKVVFPKSEHLKMTTTAMTNKI
jgi:hypothetical protein